MQRQSDVAAAGSRVGFPALLRPTCSASSLGLRQVDSMDQLVARYRQVTAELAWRLPQGCSAHEGSSSGTSPHDQGDAETVLKPRLLLEQRAEGGEVFVDLVMSDGQRWYSAVSDCTPFLKPYVCESYVVTPSQLPEEQRVVLVDAAVNCVLALGFMSGVFHVGCNMTQAGPHVIQVSPRMGGGHARESSLWTQGVDLVDETVFIALGIPARPLALSPPSMAVASCYVVARRSGTLVDLSCVEELQTHARIICAKPLAQHGWTVVGPESGNPTRLIDLVVVGATARKALDFLLKLHSELPIRID